MSTHNAYDAAKFHSVRRTWFGGSGKQGANTIPYTVLSGSATAAVIFNRVYFKGPVKVLKVGWQNVATASAAANATGASGRAVVPINFYKSSAAGVARDTKIAEVPINIHPVAITQTPLWSIGSKTTMASAEIEAGRFVTVHAATARSNKGVTAAARGTTMVSGSFAFFIDWAPKYDPSSDKWNT
jgi:hypothetical protein